MNSTGTMLTSRRRTYLRMEPPYPVMRSFLVIRTVERRGSTRLANDQGYRHHPVPLQDFVAADEREQRLGGHLAKLLQRVPDGGQGRRGVAGGRDVVEADQRHFFWDPDAGLVAAANHADRRAVVEGGDGGRAVGAVREARQEVVDHGAPALDLAGATEQPARVRLQPALGE